jgi:protein-disulfide isomerase
VFSILSGDISIRPIGTTDHVLGNPKAPVTIVEYSDTECPFCKQFHVSMHKIVEAYGKDGKVNWVYRQFPLDSLHPKAKNEARATECAAKLGGNDKFWAYIDELFRITPSNNGLDPAKLNTVATDVGLDAKAFADCLQNSDVGTAKIQADTDEAMKIGGNGTPFNVFISAKKFDVEQMKKSIATIGDKYRLPPDLFAVSKDGTKITVSGAMPYEIMEQFVKLFISLQ